MVRSRITDTGPKNRETALKTAKNVGLSLFTTPRKIFLGQTIRFCSCGHRDLPNATNRVHLGGLGAEIVVFVVESYRVQNHTVCACRFSWASAEAVSAYVSFALPSRCSPTDVFFFMLLFLLFPLYFHPLDVPVCVIVIVCECV